MHELPARCYGESFELSSVVTNDYTIHSSWAMENIIRRMLWIMGNVFYLSGCVVFSLLHVRVYRLYFIVQEHCTVSNFFLSTKWKPSPRTAKMHTLLLYLIGKNRKNSTTLCRIFQNSKVQSQMHNEIRESYIFCHVIQFWFVVCVPSSKF